MTNNCPNNRGHYTKITTETHLFICLKIIFQLHVVCLLILKLTQFVYEVRPKLPKL